MSSVESSIGLVPVVPGYVPFALLGALEAASALIWFAVFARRNAGDAGAALRCARCTLLHARAEAFARAADAAAAGALAFLAALPFVAAAYETGLTFPHALLAVSAVAAVVAVAAEANLFARALAARLWAQFTWSAEPTRIAGGGARWLGAALVLYLFQPRDALLGGDAGIGALFGAVGKRLAQDLGATPAIVAAAVIIAAAFIVALVARWLVPLVFGSSPTALVVSREPHGSVR